jgi:glycosyltransferase involved in cell wall biosynthesis
LTARRRVLVVAGWYPSPEAPIDGVFVREHARAAALRHEVVVLAIRAASGPGPLVIRTDGVEDGLRTVRIRHRALPGPTAGALYVPAARRALRGLEAEGFRPDVIHGHVYAAGLLGVLLARRRGIPVVISEHFSGFQLGTVSRAQGAMARAAFRGAAVVCPVSESLRAALAPYAPHTRMRVVPNVVDTELFAPSERPAIGEGEDVTLLCVGLLDEIKGVGTLLRALAMARERGGRLRLDLVGGGPRRPDYERLADELGLRAAVAFHGPLPKAEVAARMRTADVLVAPSLTETFGVVVAEALASGLPVVATRVGALPELVGDRAGRLVAPGDPAALADALLAPPPRSAAVADEMRRRFSRDAIAEAWSAVYEEVL